MGRLEQVEHEALVTLIAARAGVRVPEIVTAALGSQGDALIVTRQPDVSPLEDTPPDEVTDELLHAVWKEAAKLHVAGMSHGRLNGRNFTVVDGEPMLLDLSVATLGAPASALQIDVAELLVACRVLAGPERALKAALAGAGPDAVKSAIPYLERAALTPHERDLAHDHEVELKKLREAAAEATHEKVPELVPIHRVRPRDVLFHRAHRGRRVPVDHEARRHRLRHDLPRASLFEPRLGGGSGRPREPHLRPRSPVRSTPPSAAGARTASPATS